MRRMICLLLLALLLTGCGSREVSPTESSAGPETVRLTVWGAAEDEALMEELKDLAAQTLEKSAWNNYRDWNAVKADVRDEISGYLFKKTKRNPMVLPVIMEV